MTNVLTVHEQGGACLFLVIMAMIMRRQAVYTLNDFERKLIETDAYLQLLLNQIKDLDVKIKDCQNERDKKQLVEIKAKTLSLLDGVKHTIVLLQIAKVCFS